MVQCSMLVRRVAVAQCNMCEGGVAKDSGVDVGVCSVSVAGVICSPLPPPIDAPQLQELARARYGAPAGAQAAQGGNRSRSVPRGTPAGDASAGASARVSADAARAAATPEASAARVGTLGGECGAARGGRAAVFLVDTSVSDAAVDRTDNTDGGEESVAFMDVSVEGDGSPRLHEVASQAASPVNRAGEVSEISPETASTSPVQRGLVSEEEAVWAMEAAVDQSRLEQVRRRGFWCTGVG